MNNYQQDTSAVRAGAVGVSQFPLLSVRPSCPPLPTAETYIRTWLPLELILF